MNEEEKEKIIEQDKERMNTLAEEAQKEIRKEEKKKSCLPKVLYILLVLILLGTCLYFINDKFEFVNLDGKKKEPKTEKKENSDVINKELANVIYFDVIDVNAEEYDNDDPKASEKELNYYKNKKYEFWLVGCKEKNDYNQCKNYIKLIKMDKFDKYPMIDKVEEAIKEYDENGMWTLRMSHYYSKISLFQKESKLYLLLLVDSKLYVKTIDLNKGNGNYKIEDYNNVKMPSEFEGCGAYEFGTTMNACEMDFPIIDGNNVLIHYYGAGFVETFYKYNIKTNILKHLYTTDNSAGLKMPATPQYFKLDNMYIIGNTDGIFYMEKDFNNFNKIIYANSQFQGEIMLSGDPYDNDEGYWFIENDKKILYNSCITDDVDFQNGSNGNNCHTYYFDSQTKQKKEISDGFILGLINNKLYVSNENEIYVFDNKYNKVSTIKIVEYAGKEKIKDTSGNDVNVDYIWTNIRPCVDTSYSEEAIIKRNDTKKFNVCASRYYDNNNDVELPNVDGIISFDDILSKKEVKFKIVKN